MADRSTSEKTPKTSITPNTVIVLCAIVALIAALAFLESHIRSIDKPHPVGAEIRGYSPKEVWRDAEARRTEGQTCSRIRCLHDRSSTISSIERRISTCNDPSLFAFIVRKTFNQRTLLLRTPAQSAGDCIALFWCASDLGLQLRLLSATAASPEVLSEDA